MTERSATPKSIAEWVTLSLSVLVVAALILVALVEESRRQDEVGAALQVTFDIEGAVARGESYYVPYTVVNTGSEAISSAEIWIDVDDGEQVVESAEINVEFLPLEGKQDGTFITTHDPASHALRSRIESLQFP
jgi:uncharacterized protein (TIGR02588 family)